MPRRRKASHPWQVWLRANLDKKTIAGITLLAASWFQSHQAIKTETQQVDQAARLRSGGLKDRVESLEGKLDTLGVRMSAVEARKNQVVYTTVEPIGPPEHKQRGWLSWLPFR